MSGVVFQHTLRRGLRPALIWGVVTAFFANYVLFITPNMEGLQGFVAVFEAMPKVLLQAFGLTDVRVLATPEGFVGLAYFTYAAIVMAIYAVSAGMSITANDEENGIMNMVLALPVSRWSLVIEKALAQTLLAMLVCGIGFAGFAMGTRFNPVVSGLDLGRSAEVFAALWTLILAVMGITIICGVIIRRRGAAVAAVTGYLVVSYIAFTLGSLAGDTVGPILERLSVFSYFDGGEILRHGLDVIAPLMMAVVGAVLIGCAARLYERRDISG